MRRSDGDVRPGAGPPTLSRRPEVRLGADYTRLWVASAVSNLGDGVRLAALPLLAASLTRDPGPIAGIRFAGSLPWLLFALVAGVVVDRVDRRGLMWTVQAGRAGLMALLGLAVLAGVDGPVLLGLVLAVAFALGVGEVLFDNAAQALMPRIVPRDRLQAANGRLYAAEEVTNRLAGPPLGAFLFVAAAAAPFLFDAATFGVAAVLVFLLAGVSRPAEEAPARPGTVRHQVAEGLAWLWANRLLRALAAWTGLFNLTSAATSAIVVLYALEVLELSEAGFGVLLGVGALGGAAGGVLGHRLARRFGDGPSLVAITAGGGAANLALGLTSSPVVAAAAIASLGLGAMWGAVIAVSLRQAVVPDRLLGRVNSAYRLLAWGTQPVGALLGGVLATTLGLRAPYLLAAAVLWAMAGLMPLWSRRAGAVPPAKRC